MGAIGSSSGSDGLDPGELRPGEVVLYRWGSPGGRGLLTNLRCLLLGRRRPVRRPILWSIDLQEVTALSVQKVRGPRGTRVSVRGSLGGGTVSTGSIDPTYGVSVNETSVLIGEPNACSDLQRRIDEARTARCLSLYGRLVPYHSSPEGPGRGPTVRPTLGPSNSTGAGAPVGPTARFLLFLAGEPFQEGVPGARHPVVFAVSVAGGAGPVDSYGGHIPADHAPGQIYGPQAEMARMVLDLANGCGVSVKIVDVERPGSDADLVQQHISPDDVLPALLRPDGRRLSGSESIVPARVAVFLQGR